MLLPLNTARMYKIPQNLHKTDVDVDVEGMVLLAFLSAMVFKLPPDSGEKMGFSLTVLLAYAVYLTIISDDMPSTSTSTSVLCKFCGILYISDLILKSYVCTRFY
jgi:hypothetical protein